MWQGEEELQQNVAGVNVAIGLGVIVVTIFTYFINPTRLLICALNLHKCGNIWLGLLVSIFAHPTIRLCHYKIYWFLFIKLDFRIGFFAAA